MIYLLANEFYITLFREQTEIYLHDKDIGVFIIRKSESMKNCYVLSVKVPKFINQSQISHYLIEKKFNSSTILSNEKKLFKKKSYYKLRGCDNRKFPTLTTLVTHCSFVRDTLPIILNLNYYQQIQQQQERDRLRQLDENEQQQQPTRRFYKSNVFNEFLYYSSGSSIASSVSSSSSDFYRSSDHDSV